MNSIHFQDNHKARPSFNAICILLLFCLLFSFSVIGCINTAPTAEFSALPTFGYEPMEVKFFDQSSGQISSWEWDFNGDGIIDSILRNPTYTYHKPGTYSVNLTVANYVGHNNKIRLDYIRVQKRAYVVDFMANPTRTFGIQEIQFTDLSGGNITDWAWDFDGDNVTDSTQQNPKHTYRMNGDYSVTLKITGTDYELSLTKVDYIRVRGCPT